jgi:hypothetical protein
MRFERIFIVLASVVALSAGPASAASSSPPQRLRSALLMYPLIVSDSTRNTRVEIVNLTGTEKQLKCVYLTGEHCSETNFYVTLTANQPMSWLASQGTFNSKSRSAVPPFYGTGQLQCAVEPEQPDVDFHNAIQGRAVVFRSDGSDGETLGYGAVGFQRLTGGDFTGRADLDGSTYTQCPDELHFAFLASDTGSDSEIVLVPCSQDVLTSTPTTVVQIRIVNEFEQTLSASFTVSCQAHSELDRISSAFTRATLGSETGHVILRGVQSPILGMVIDRFTPGDPAAAANEPILRGGRSATVVIP